MHGPHLAHLPSALLIYPTRRWHVNYGTHITPFASRNIPGGQLSASRYGITDIFPEFPASLALACK